MDARDYARENKKWYKSFSEDKMIALVSLLYEDDNGEEIEEDVEFPIKFEVCHLCDGKGKHVNPAIDSHGISAWEFEDDPDFADSYMSGAYDVSCYECKGKRVTPEIDEDYLDDEQKRNLSILRKMEEEEIEYAYICAAERRMGA